MDIAIVNLTRGGFSGGYRKYLRRIVPLMRRDPRVSRMVLYLPESDRAPEVELDSVRHWPVGSDGIVKRWLRESNPDVVFVPTAQTIDCGRPVVCMVRNMEPLLVPFGENPWPEKLRNVGRAWAARRAARRADRVIAVSQHVRDFLAERWHIDEAKIGVVPHGVDAAGAQRRPAAAAGAEPGSFLFTAGSIRPARGLDDLLGALALLPKTLLVAGEPDAATRAYAARLRRRAAGLPIVWLGAIEPEEMAWCFANCRAFVMTSRAEACPNTVLEAMAGGCLSVSTDRAPMPEFFGDSALYYRGGDARDLAARLASLDDLPPAAIDALRGKALQRAGRFDWETTAHRTVTELELAIR